MSFFDWLFKRTPPAPKFGDVMVASNDEVTVIEVAEHWVRFRRSDGTGGRRNRRGFMKNYHMKHE